MDDEDEVLQLPADTLEALQEFQTEKNEREKQFQSLKANSEQAFADSNAKLSMEMFSEDWNASQFWYTDDTARVLARELLRGIDSSSAIAIVSAPSVYIALRNIINEEHIQPAPRLCLFEFDDRFEVFGKEFVHFDFQNPLRLDPALRGGFDRIICDPPFLSEDCQTKTALAVKYLAKTWEPSSQTRSTLRLVSCTGERMELVVLRLYGRVGLRTTSFEPKHGKGLSNEFRCYANFQCPSWSLLSGS